MALKLSLYAVSIEDRPNPDLEHFTAKRAKTIDESDRRGGRADVEEVKARALA